MRLSIVFGAFAIIVILLMTGCSASTTPTYSMPVRDLNHYQVDCSKKEEQIRFIQSMRPSNQQRNTSAVLSTIPFAWLADAGNRGGHEDVASGRKDWMLNQILMELSRCP